MAVTRSLARTPRAAGTLPPWAIFPLLLPWAIAGGYTSIALVYFFAEAGLGTTAIAAYLSVVLVPQTLKVLWAPLIDMTLGPRRWHLIGTVATAVLLLALGLVPMTRADLLPLTMTATACGFVSTLVHLPNDVIMAYDVADARKGRAAGWGSAANLGGGAIGGGLAIWLAQQGLSGWMPALVLAALCLACAPVVLMAAPRPPAGKGGNGITGVRALVVDLRTLIGSRRGALALVLVALPIGTGGLMNLWPALARDWHAGAGAVVLVSGLGGGLVQIAGALAAGPLCDRFDRKATYCWLGVAAGLVAFAMAAWPRSPAAFVGFALVYLTVTGACYAAFTAVALEAIGRGAAATKLMLFVCVGNVAVSGVELLDGMVHDRLDATGMLLVEAALGIGAALLFAAVALLTPPRFRRAALALPPRAGDGVAA